MDATKESVGNLLDALYLEMFDLIEQQAQSRVNIELWSNSGQLLLAKTRYVQGSQTVSAAQIPTENSVEFSALCHVDEQSNSNRLSGTEVTLVRDKPNKNRRAVEPLHWFAVLAPSSLRTAAEQFKKCLNFVIESANLQRELIAVIENIAKLKKFWSITYMGDEKKQIK